MNRSRTPDFMPMLARGRHRNPRKGACFMEMASYLAGERWSDHPRCTQPVVATLARAVNDCVSDEARQRLTPLIPRVVGLRTDDLRFDAWVAREAALAALPVASMTRQRVAAVGVLRSEAVLAELEGRPPDSLSERARSALATVPDAERWARDFCAIGPGSTRSFPGRSAPAIVRHAVLGIAEACISDPDALLVDLLRRTVDEGRAFVGPVTPERSTSSPVEVDDHVAG